MNWGATGSWHGNRQTCKRRCRGDEWLHPARFNRPQKDTLSPLPTPHHPKYGHHKFIHQRIDLFLICLFLFGAIFLSSALGLDARNDRILLAGQLGRNVAPVLLWGRFFLGWFFCVFYWPSGSGAVLERFHDGPITNNVSRFEFLILEDWEQFRCSFGAFLWQSSFRADFESKEFRALWEHFWVFLTDRAVSVQFRYVPLAEQFQGRFRVEGIQSTSECF